MRDSLAVCDLRRRGGVQQEQQCQANGRPRRRSTAVAEHGTEEAEASVGKGKQRHSRAEASKGKGNQRQDENGKRAKAEASKSKGTARWHQVAGCQEPARSVSSMHTATHIATNNPHSPLTFQRAC